MKRKDVIAHQTGVAGPKPGWLKDRLEWFQDQKFGLILHWGIYSLWDCCESWPLSPGDEWARADDMECWTSRGKDLELFQKDYWALNKQFNPVNFDPSAWAKLFRHSGAKYVAFTTKHHDGFCMWDTETTDYKLGGPGSPYKGDVFKGLCEALHEEELGVSAYFSKADWHCPDYWSPDFPVVDRQANTVKDPIRWKRFVDYTHKQIRELMTGYGKIDVLWLDAGWVKDEEDIDMEGMVAMARKLQPGLIVANRTVGDAFEDFITPEHQIPDEPLPQPWESCLCMAQNWKYHPRDTYKPTIEILRMLVEIISKGGNFLLGVGPTPEGEFTAEAVQRLNELGDWFAINGEAVYGTRAISPYQEGDVRFTQKDGYVYAFTESESIELKALRPIAQEIELLGWDGPIDAVMKDKSVVLTVPKDTTALPRPFVFKYRPTQSLDPITD